jgi:hypothetical protein
VYVRVTRIAKGGRGEGREGGGVLQRQGTARGDARKSVNQRKERRRRRRQIEGNRQKKMNES